jgi:hypothetical protein
MFAIFLTHEIPSNKTWAANLNGNFMANRTKNLTVERAHFLAFFEKMSSAMHATPMIAAVCGEISVVSVWTHSRSPEFCKNLMADPPNAANLLQTEETAAVAALTADLRAISEELASDTRFPAAVKNEPMEGTIRRMFSTIDGLMKLKKLFCTAALFTFSIYY